MKPRITEVESIQNKSPL